MYQNINGPILTIIFKQIEIIHEMYRVSSLITCAMGELAWVLLPLLSAFVIFNMNKILMFNQRKIVF